MATYPWLSKVPPDLGKHSVSFLCLSLLSSFFLLSFSSPPFRVGASGLRSVASCGVCVFFGSS